MVNKVHVCDVREGLKKLYNDVQARWDAKEKELQRLTWASNTRDEVKDEMLALAHEQRGLIAAIVMINGLAVGLTEGTKVYDYRRESMVEGVLVHPRDVGEEDEDSTVEEWGFHEDFMEMVPVRWCEGEPAAWHYAEDLARVPEL